MTDFHVQESESGSWRRWPILGALYSDRRSPRVVLVVNVTGSDTHVGIIRVDNGSNRHTQLRGEQLLDEGRWHLIGVIEAIRDPDFEGGSR